MIPVVLRITRHETDAARLAALQAAFGPGVLVVCQDVRFDGDPVAAVQATIERLQAGGGKKVVAIDAIVPFNILRQLVEGRAAFGEAVILRAEHQRDPATGRVKVVGKKPQGRDILAFDHYEILERVEFVTRPLL